MYFLSSIGVVPTTPVKGATFVLDGGGARSMLSLKTGLIVVRINVIF